MTLTLLNGFAHKFFNTVVIVIVVDFVSVVGVIADNDSRALSSAFSNNFY